MKRLAILIVQSIPLLAFSQFVSITDSPIANDGQASYGVAWIDYDNDGFEDLFVTMSTGTNGVSRKNALYRNLGDGTFEKITTGDIVNNDKTGRNSSWADFNNDGFIDGFIAAQLETDLYKNNNGDSFEAVSGELTTTLDFSSDHSGGVWGDFDNDGDVDLYLASYQLSLNSFNFLYVNNGDESFTAFPTTDVVSAPGHSAEPSWIDYDNNGTLDLFVPNYCESSYVYSNQGDGTFKKVDKSSSFFTQSSCSTGMSWADFDNDGDYDVFVHNNVNSPSNLYLNTGNGDFVEKAGFTTHTSSSAAWGDFNNDGFIDLIMVGSYPERKTYLYRNNGGKSFTEVSDQVGITHTNYSWGVAWADYDKDGFLDFVIANAPAESPYEPNDRLYHNTPNGNGWINARLVGTNSNRSAIGASVKIKAGGHWQYRTIQSKTGNNSQNSLNVHFGVGNAAKIDSLIVYWPGFGSQVLVDAAINQFIEIAEIDLPPPPIGLTAEGEESGTINLSWVDEIGDETGFRVERSKDGINFQFIIQLPANSTSYTDEITTSGSYTYRVAATSSGGWSNYAISLPVEVTIATIATITAVEQDESLKIYPNPFESNLIINGFKSFEVREAKLLDSNGKLIAVFNLEKTHGKIPGEDLPQGLYFLQIGEHQYRVLKR